MSDGDVVHWLFNDTQIISASNSDYTVAGGNLTINSFQFEQAGVYRCVASTDGGSTLQVSHAGRVWYLGKRCGLHFAHNMALAMFFCAHVHMIGGETQCKKRH